MPTFHIQQFGCRATQADGAAIERQLTDRGYIAVSDPSDAAIVVLNTCTVTAAADAQARDAIRRLHTENPAAKLIVTGCYAQRAPEELAALPGVTWVVGNSHKPQIPDLIDTRFVGAGLAPPTALDRDTQLPTTSDSPTTAFIPTTALLPKATASFHSFVDAAYPFVRVPHVHPELRRAAPASGKIVPRKNTQPHANILTGGIFAHPEFLSAPIQGGELHHTRPILKIQDGCNLRCTYCIIPSVRGKSRSLPPEDTIREIQSLVAQACPEPRRALLPVRFSQYQSPNSTAGQPILFTLSHEGPVHSSTPHQSPSAAKEIVLSGINLGSYGRDLTPRTSFLDLLRRILSETNLDHLRISSVEPQDVTQDLIDLVASTDRVAQHFHMPLQSASNRILKAMHRRYRTAHYAARLDRIHAVLPNAAIGADVIAGFPGETEQDHAATLTFIEQSPFTYLHVFSYSSRPGTEAASHSDQIPASTVKRRARELRALGEQKSAAFRKAQIGRTLRVLTLHREERTNGALAHTTPALSTNYLRVQVPAISPSNQWIEIRITNSEGNFLCGEIPESDDQTLSDSSARGVNPNPVGAPLC
jgi:threonylcarbamoyladenosine tRNA methylthiotransferase MtaB